MPKKKCYTRGQTPRGEPVFRGSLLSCVCLRFLPPLLVCLSGCLPHIGPLSKACLSLTLRAYARVCVMAGVSALVGSCFEGMAHTYVFPRRGGGLESCPALHLANHGLYGRIGQDKTREKKRTPFDALPRFLLWFAGVALVAAMAIRNHPSLSSFSSFSKQTPCVVRLRQHPTTAARSHVPGCHCCWTHTHTSQVCASNQSYKKTPQ